MMAPIVASASRWGRLTLVVAFFAVAVGAFAVPDQRKIDALNFTNTEIPVVLKALADISGANIVIGPSVKGPITLKLKDVTLDEALRIITDLSGLSYREANGTYLVNTREEINKIVSQDQDYLVLKLKVLSSADAIAALGVAYKDISVKDLPDKRLVLTGDKARLNAAKAFLAEVDVAPPSPPKPENQTQFDTTEATYQLKSVVSWQAKKYLEDLYRGNGLSITYAPTSRGLDPINATAPAVPTPKAQGDATQTAPATEPAQGWESDRLILRGPKAVVEQALASIAKVDVETPLVEKRCSVQRIYGSQAIAYLLERYQGQGLMIFTAPMTYAAATDPKAGASAQIGTAVRRDKDGKLNVAEPVGDFIIRGPEAIVKDALGTLQAIDIGAQRVERVVSVRFLKADDAKVKLEELYGKDGLQVTVAPQRRGATKEVVTNEAASTTESKSEPVEADIFDLVLRGPEGVVTQAQATLTRLDSEPAQIAINTEIVSINSTELKNLGVVWSGASGQPGAVDVVLNEQQSGDPLQFGRIVRNPITLNARLNALQTADKAKIISRPSTVVQNGRDAFIHVGDEVYYEVLSAVDNGVPVYSLNSIKTGVTLQVRPQMSSDGVITLEITSNFTEPPTFVKGISGADLPRFRVSASTTVVQVRDTETLVIGGLTQNRQEETKTEVPVLSKIPLLGNLFKNRSYSPSQTELLILVTPNVVRPGAPSPIAVPQAAQE